MSSNDGIDDIDLNKFEEEFIERSSTKAPLPIEQKLGAFIRSLRLNNRLTLSDLAGSAGISAAMLSRFETGGTSASLEVMQRLARALGMPLSVIFKSIEESTEEGQLIKVADQMEVVRTGSRKGTTYRLLSYSPGPQKHFESFLITMDNERQSYRLFQHSGHEFIYMLKGNMKYRCGSMIYDLAPGDALTLPAARIHGPEYLEDVEIQFLSIIMYDDES
ncbi:MAG: XRE family transcriptional regulator [Roseiarcus sp.]|jgi:transcriptional regulator with XRE-family HTH domain